MGKFMVIFLIAAVLIFSCQQPLNQNSVVETVTQPNGDKITAEEKSKLDALQPKVDSIIAEVCGNKAELSDGKLIINDQNALLEKVKNLLKGEFGDDYGKFIIQKEHRLISVQNSDKLESSMVDTSKSSILKSISGSIKKVEIGKKIYSGGSKTINTDIYYLNVTVGTVKTPWFSYNYATQSFTHYYSSLYYDPLASPPRSGFYDRTDPYCPSYSQVIAIWDGDGKDWSNTVLHTNSTQSPVSELSVIGALVMGYYPETKFWAETMSFANDPNLYNSSCQILYIWGQ